MSDFDWEQLRDDDPVGRGPSAATDVPLPVGFPELPFDKMDWPNFESLLGTVLRDGEGLRRFARLYGRSGQKQDGIDVIAFEADKSVVALQSKRYQTYTETDFRSAVAEFMEVTRKYKVGRFIIASSAAQRDKKIDDALAELSANMAPLELEYWDPHHLSEVLRSKPDVVSRYFGQHTAEMFCGALELIPKQVPRPEAVRIREGLARSPEDVTGARPLLDQAVQASDEDAVVLYEKAQDLLRADGFNAFADLHEPARQDRLVSLGRAEEAAGSLVDAMWTSVHAGRLITAGESLRRLDAIRSKDNSKGVKELFTVASTALNFVQNPDRDLPDPLSLAVGRDTDRAQLLLLVGETALADANSTWLSVAELPIAELIGRLPASQELLVRLQMLLADARNDWASLARSARKLEFGYPMSGIVMARYARACVFDEDFQAADDSWEDAAAAATLASQWDEAAAWTFSRRVFMARWNPFGSNKLLPHNLALTSLGPSSPIVPAHASALESALAAQVSGRIRDAIRAAYRALRQAVSIGDWAREEEARKVLAECLVEDEQLDLALMQHARSGTAGAGQDLVKEHPNRFLDVSEALDSPLYWVVGSAYKALAAEADAVPDSVVSTIGTRILRDVRRMEEGTGSDIPAFASSRYGGAVACAAGLADRLGKATAEALLDHFGRQKSLEDGQHRFHDNDEAEAVAGIAQSHTQLTERALKHLVALMNRSEPSRKRAAYAALDAYPALVEPLLRDLAKAGSSWAEECLAVAEMEDPPEERAQAALRQLTAPLVHTRGYTTFGTAAQRDATLVRGLPESDAQASVESLLAKAADVRAASLDRSEYILAAAALADRLSEPARAESFATLLSGASTPAFEDPGPEDDPMMLDVSIFGRDLRGYYLQAASRFASGKNDLIEVKNIGFALLGVSDTLDYRVAAALHPHRNEVIDESDIPILAMQRHWSLRALASERWVTLETPEAVGRFLAKDEDPRVRRSLASALADAGQASGTEAARTILLSDTLHSIRVLAATHRSSRHELPGMDTTAV